jgi:hypothetical protein
MAGSGFSPDHTRIALANRYDKTIQVVDATTGAVQQRVNLATAGALIGWYDDQHLLVRSDGYRADSHSILQVVDLTGRMTGSISLLAMPQNLYVGSSKGLIESAAGLAF